MSNIIVVLRYTNEAAFLNRMASIGLAERVFEEGTGSPLMRFGQGGNGTPCESVDTNEVFIAIRFPKEDIDKMPPANNPAFALVYDPREEDAIWPTYTVNTYDEDGNITGTRQQGVGGLA